MPSLDAIDHMALQMESHPKPTLEPEGRPELEEELEPIPASTPGSKLDESSPLKSHPPLIPTESHGSESCANAASTSTIKRKLRIQPVSVWDFAKYMKSKRRADLKYEWEVKKM